MPDDQRAVAHAQHPGFGEHNLGNLIRAPNLRAHGCPLRTDLLGNRSGRLRGFGLGFRYWFWFRLRLLLHHGFGRRNRFGFWGWDLCHFGFGFWSSRCLRCSLGCFPCKTLGFPLVDPTTWRGRGRRRRRRWRWCRSRGNRRSLNHSPTRRRDDELRRQDFQKQPGRGGVAHFVHIAVDGGGDGSQSRWLEGRGLPL